MSTRLANSSMPVSQLPFAFGLLARGLHLARRCTSSRIVDVIAYHINDIAGSRIAHRNVVARLQGGVAAVIPMSDHGMRRVALLGEYEPELRVFAEQVLQPGDLVLDVGANVGLHTVVFADLVGPRGMVLAFEPAPVPCSFLRETIRANGFDARVRVIAAAVGAAAGRTRLWLDDGIGLTNSTRHDWSNASCAITVEVVTLDDVVTLESAHRPLGLIKVDVEGAEADVVAGATTLRSSRLPRGVILETSSSDSSNDAVKAWEDVGYVRVQRMSKGSSMEAPPSDADGARFGEPGFWYANVYLLRDDVVVQC